MENKTGKYLKYAIGEIALVVIGILIALQINNWNEERKVNSTQLKYLKLLKNEAQSNLASINFEIGIAKKLVSKQKEIFRLIDTPKDTLSEKYVSEVFFPAFSTILSFKYKNSVLNEINNSGELKNIKNDSLRIMLIDLDTFIKIVRYQEDNTYNAQMKILDHFHLKGDTRLIVQDVGFNNELGIGKTKKESGGNKILLEDDYFTSQMVMYLTITSNLNNQLYPRLRNRLIEVIKKIDNEINLNR